MFATFFIFRLNIAGDLSIFSHIQIENEYTVRANFAELFTGVQGSELFSDIEYPQFVQSITTMFTVSIEVYA
jgi:hypothetical protein